MGSADIVGQDKKAMIDNGQLHFLQHDPPQDQLASSAYELKQDAVTPSSDTNAALDIQYACHLRERMLEASHVGTSALQTAVPASEVCSLLLKSFMLLKSEATVVEVRLEQTSMEVIVVGDTHGQFHDVCHMLDLFGLPSNQRLYIFNGDFVDRGAWGLEVLLYLLTLKLALPSCVHCLRGNHESTTCTKFYGFKGELDAKYGSGAKGLPLQTIYQLCKKVFSSLPLAAVVQNKTLVLHGGLFRHVVHHKGKLGKRRRRQQQQQQQRSAAAGDADNLEVGSLEELRAAGKGGMDPDGIGASVIAADVLWSDPIAEPGLHTNDARGVGLTFGPDITQLFLEQEGLGLIIRSHEGPDARDQRTDMPQVLEGYSIDHDTPAGKVITVFSAPDYPQFQDSPTRYNNKGAVAVLTAPDFATPLLKSFEAARPRPEAPAYYDFHAYADTDEDIEGNASGTSMDTTAEPDLDDADVAEGPQRHRAFPTDTESEVGSSPCQPQQQQPNHGASSVHDQGMGGASRAPGLLSECFPDGAAVVATTGGYAGTLPDQLQTMASFNDTLQLTDQGASTACFQDSSGYHTAAQHTVAKSCSQHNGKARMGDGADVVSSGRDTDGVNPDHHNWDKNGNPVDEGMDYELQQGFTAVLDKLVNVHASLHHKEPGSL